MNVWKKPRANAGPDKKIIPGLRIQLDGSVSGTSVNFIWTPPDYLTSPAVLRPSANPPVTQTYSLRVESMVGCGFSIDDVTVKVFDKPVIPNAFSPNGDGINDTWFIDPLYLFTDCLVEVYNRYGQPVYRSRGYTSPWDGKMNGRPLPTGTYYYYIDLKLPGKMPIAGSVTIVR